MSYIPTQEERIKVYTKLKDSNKQNDLNQANKLKANQEEAHRQKLSGQSLAALIERLTKATNKQCVIQNRTENILKINCARRKAAGNDKVQDRLLKAGRQLQIKKEQLKNKQHMRVMTSMQGTPNITQKAKRIVNRPFVERVDEIVNQKQEMLRKLAEKTNPQFKPQLNSYSLFMAEVHNSKDFLSRAQQYEASKKQAIAEKIKQKQHEELRGSTFNPQINQKSREIASCRPSKSISKTSNIKQNKSSFAFKPQINSNSVILAKERASSVCHQRLYQDMRKVNEKMSKLREQQQRKYTYKPNVNRKSLQIAIHKSKISKDQYCQTQGLFEEIPFMHQQLFQDDEKQYSQQVSQNMQADLEKYQQVPFRKINESEPRDRMRPSSCKAFSTNSKSKSASRFLR